MRRELRGFAQLMEAKLSEKDEKYSKRNFLDFKLIHVYRKLRSEVKELDAEMKKKEIDPGRVVAECIDVANMCMMVAYKVDRRQSAR